MTLQGTQHTKYESPSNNIYEIWKIRSQIKHEPNQETTWTKEQVHRVLPWSGGGSQFCMPRLMRFGASISSSVSPRKRPLMFGEPNCTGRAATLSRVQRGGLR